ncbi:hypothetical protein CPB86DRAFT_357376 [Serendipita vermifera]|nr:hypothetical protein CPB86DRAFT_357376 [Serendipita vermifera]
MSAPRRIRKVVLVGDPFLGKTYLKVADIVDIKVEEQPLTLALWEVPSQGVYSRIL